MLEKRDGNALKQPYVDFALLWAAYEGNVRLIEMLLRAGADISYRDKGNNAEGYASQRGHKEAVDFLKSWGGDEICLTRPLGSCFLEEFYHFGNKERITLVRRERNGVIDAVTRESFAVLNETALRAAFNEYRRKGGKRDESEFFENQIYKPKITRPTL